jgi:tryptophan-rich sensory protein
MSNRTHPFSPVAAHGPAGPGRAAALLPAAAAILTAVVGGAAASDAAGFYAQLDRPSWAPPAWLFGPAWTVLYLMIAVAGWRVLRAVSWREHAPTLSVYALQFVLNGLWSWLFFAWHSGAWAFAGALALAGSVLLNVWLFWRLQALAGALLLPYAAWVSFASLLTWSVWQRNPQLLG